MCSSDPRRVPAGGRHRRRRREAGAQGVLRLAARTRPALAAGTREELVEAASLRPGRGRRNNGEAGHGAATEELATGRSQEETRKKETNRSLV